MSLMKGAFIVFATQVPVPSNVIIFQFNSETLARKVDPQKDNSPNTGPNAKGAQGATHTTHPPVESLTVSIDLDASDQLADGDTISTDVGLHPALAQLELLMYPNLPVVLLNKALRQVGIATIAPSFSPLVLFVWGTTRILPVQVTSLQITEQQFDDRLNPITAKVDVGLTVLQEEDLTGAYATLATILQVEKVGLAAMGVGQSLSHVTALLPF